MRQELAVEVRATRKFSTALRLRSSLAESYCVVPEGYGQSTNGGLRIVAFVYNDAEIMDPAKTHP
jgi:hypothetical protein